MSPKSCWMPPQAQWTCLTKQVSELRREGEGEGEGGGRVGWDKRYTKMGYENSNDDSDGYQRCSERCPLDPLVMRSAREDHCRAMRKSIEESWESEKVREWERERVRGWEGERVRGWEGERVSGREEQRDRENFTSFAYSMHGEKLHRIREGKI